MIDLHCHILPGIDDGAADLETALAMARAFVEDGVHTVACTPHILPGLYDNDGPAIRSAVRSLQDELDRRQISLQLVTGADVHIVPRMVEGIRSDKLLTLADSRYVLVELPHYVAPPRIEHLFFQLRAAEYVPILSHPERLSWLPGRYDLARRLVASGVWIQITAGSLAGIFGHQPRQLANQMLDDELVHIIATDAHDYERRRPDLRRGYELAAARIGEAAAWDLVSTHPRRILENAAIRKANPTLEP